MSTPWTAAHQVLLSFTISRSLLKFVSLESVMLSNHLILCHPLLLLPSNVPSIRVFSNALFYWKGTKETCHNHKREKTVLYNQPPLPASAQTPIRCFPSCWSFRRCTPQAAACPAQPGWCNLYGRPLKWCSMPVTPEPSWRTPVENTQTQGLKVTSVLQESYDSSYTANSRFSYHLPITQNNSWVESPNMASKRNQGIRFFCMCMCSASQWSNTLMGTLVVKSLSRIQFLWPCGPEPARLFCPWDFPGKNTRLGCHFLLRG